MSEQIHLMNFFVDSCFYFGFKQHTLVRIAILTAAAAPLPGCTNMYLSDEWKKADLNPVPSEPIWGCNIMSPTSLKGFLSVQATKKWRHRKPSRKIQATWMCNVWLKISLSLLFQRLSKMYSRLRNVTTGCFVQQTWFIRNVC